jgi:putative ABC transport system permease protein
MLRKNSGYSLVAVIALALGIGANSTVFVTVNAMLLRPMPFRDLDRVVAVWTTVPARHVRRSSVSPADYREWREQNTVFTHLAAGHAWDANLTGNGLPERVEGYQVTGDYFPLLGIEPILGRAINEDDQQPGRNRVVVLSYRLWKNRFAGDKGMVGKNLTLNGQELTVVGVMPREFDFPLGTGVWGPLALTPKDFANRDDSYLKIIGRIKPELSLQDAQTQMDTISARLAQQYPDSDRGHGARVVTVVRDLNDVTRDFLILLMGAAVFVLLLACANIANLQLARATARHKELALRTALGASRFRLVRQIMVESQLLSIIGGVAAILLAFWSTQLTRASLPPFILEHIPGLQHLDVDYRVIVFTFALSVAAGLISGILPALHASGDAHLGDALKEGGRTASAGSARHRLRAVLIVSEVTLALVLLIGSGLLVKGFRNLMRADQGFDTSNVLTFRVTLPKASYPQASQRTALYDAVTQKLAVLNGVESASSLSSVPSSWSWNSSYLLIEGKQTAPGEVRTTVSQNGGPDFLRVLRIPLLRGRSFNTSDGPDTQPVALISETLAQRYFNGTDPIGKRIKLSNDEQEPWRTVVGVVGDVRMSSFDRPFYTTYTAASQVAPQATSFVVRTNRDPMSLAAAVRAQVASVDPGLPIYDIRTQDQVIGDNISGVQFSARMMIAFGIISLVLAAAGIYAVMSYSVTQRTHEIGVRMALGARPIDVLSMIVTYTLKLASLGITIGLPIAFAVSRLLRSAMLGVFQADAWIFVAFPMVLGATALLAGYIPARWATRVDPMEALRSE